MNSQIGRGGINNDALHRVPMKTGLLLVKEGEEEGESIGREKMMKGEILRLRVGTLNVGNMTGKARETVDIMQAKKVAILCVQETR